MLVRKECRHRKKHAIAELCGLDQKTLRRYIRGEREPGLADRPEEKDAKYILRRLAADGRTELSKRELLRLCQRFRSTEDMDAGLAELVQRGYLRTERIKTGGRSTEQIILNPEAIGQK